MNTNTETTTEGADKSHSSPSPCSTRIIDVGGCNWKVDVYKVKVTKCESPSYWYADHVGDEFEAVKEGNSFLIIEDYATAENAPMRMIRKEDCEIISS